jgi:hypothetical protein
MTHQFSLAPSNLAGAAVMALLAVLTLGPQPGPPSGYYDIPTGYDFPADKQTLEKYRVDQNVHAQRLHVWNVFAGMTQPTPDGKYSIWETWYSEEETFQIGATPQAIGPRRVIRRFRQPNQFRFPKGVAAPQAAGTALMSFVLYNYAAYNQIRTNKLNVSSELDNLKQSGTPDPKVPDNRMISDFPNDAVSLKTVWWPVAKDKVTPLPVWDPDATPARPNGNPFSTWPRVVAVDPLRTNIPPGEMTNIAFLNKQFPNSHVVGLTAFHYVVLDAQTAANAMQNGQIANAARQALGRALQAGDYAVFVGTHITTKEIDDWVWATFWWHDHPDDGPYAADRPDTVKGPWRNYLMNVSYDLNLPREKDTTPHIAFNPWLEAGFPNGVVSNCMNCHNRASWQPNWKTSDPSGRIFLPIYRGDLDLKGDPSYSKGQLRTDFLWSIPFDAQ